MKTERQIEFEARAKALLLTVVGREQLVALLARLLEENTNLRENYKVLYDAHERCGALRGWSDFEFHAIQADANDVAGVINTFLARSEPGWKVAQIQNVPVQKIGGLQSMAVVIFERLKQADRHPEDNKS